MRNIRLTIEYDGTDYNGWQVQNKRQRRKGGRVKTIQGAIEGALFKLFSKKVRLISCSRTDSGVHAKTHIANFRISTSLKPIRIKKALNSILPYDIAVKEIKEVDLSFNSQHDALSKTYRYLICNQDYISPFLRRYAYHFIQPLDIALMRKEAKTLLGRHDFTSFKSSYAKSASANRTSDYKRTIKRLDIRKKRDMIEIEIEADGFLYNMVRNIVGTLIETGREKLPPGSIKKILKKRDRRFAGPTVPAKALHLTNVNY